MSRIDLQQKLIDEFECRRDDAKARIENVKVTDAGHAYHTGAMNAWDKAIATLKEYIAEAKPKFNTAQVLKDIWDTKNAKAVQEIREGLAKNLPEIAANKNVIDALEKMRLKFAPDETPDNWRTTYHIKTTEI